MRIILAVAFMLSAAGIAVAGEPWPIPFNSTALSLNLAEPYGDSTFVVECDTQTHKIKTVKMRTKKGDFVADPKLTAGVVHPHSVRFTSLDGFDSEIGELFIYINYSPSRGNTKEVVFEFDNGVFRLP